MELSYPEEYTSKSTSSEETDQITDDMGTGRSYECVYCKRGFTTAQALGGHMNIHRKDRANKAKPNFPPSSSSKVIDQNFADLGFYPPIPTHLVAGGNNNNNNYYSTAPDHHEVDTNSNYHQFYFPAHACGSIPSSQIENQRDRRHLFGQDWGQRGLSLYTNNPLCVHGNKDKIEDNSEEDGLDLELRLGHHP